MVSFPEGERLLRGVEEEGVIFDIAASSVGARSYGRREGDKRRRRVGDGRTRPLRHRRTAGAKEGGSSGGESKQAAAVVHTRTGAEVICCLAADDALISGILRVCHRILQTTGTPETLPRVPSGVDK